jgi:hypothetical protein
MIRESAMMPWIISHDLMRATEEETVRATQYAHHRAHTHRRPVPFLTALLRAGMGRVPVPRRVNAALVDLTSMARDTLRLTVSDLGRIGPVDPSTEPVRQTASRDRIDERHVPSSDST